MMWVGPALARETVDRLEAAIAEAAGPLDVEQVESTLRPADGAEPPD